MKWHNAFAIVLVVVAAGMQSAVSATTELASLLNFPMITVALLSTYPKVDVLVLTSAFAVTRIAIGTESIPVTLFRSVVSTMLSVNIGLRLMNHGWLLAVTTVASCILIDLLAAIVAHPKYVAMVTIADTVVSVLFNAGITLLCAVPLEVYYRRRHINGF